MSDNNYLSSVLIKSNVKYYILIFFYYSEVFFFFFFFFFFNMSVQERGGRLELVTSTSLGVVTAD
jgi:hypothetical protein